MELELKRDRIKNFENRMSEIQPWMHFYKFGENIFTGYYKYEGLGQSLTYVNSKSKNEDIRKMKRAYGEMNEQAWQRFLSKIFDKVSTQHEKDKCLLDISSATGKISITAVNNGFKKVVASEIRNNQCEQLELILNSLKQERYRKAITVINDSCSADSKDFPKKYSDMGIDVALSFGLLYHLANPFQHIVNLREITRKYAILYTMTHHSPFCKNKWVLTIEDSEFITKATSSISWTPHFTEVERVCKKAGFSNVDIVYPDEFEKNFPDFKKQSLLTDMKLIFAKILNKAFGIRFGMEKNMDFNYFKYLNLNPLYFAYILEK